MRNPFFTLATAALFILPLMFLCRPLPAAAQKTAEATVALTSQQISMDQTAVLEVTVNGVKSMKVEAPRVEGLALHPRGKSSRVEIINGDYSASVTARYIVEPLKEGNYTLPSFAIQTSQGKLTTTPLTLEVLASAPPKSGKDGNDRKKQDNIAFLRVKGLPTKVYRGQSIPVTINAYFRRGIRAEIDSLPEILGESYILSPLPEKPEQTGKRLHGKEYVTVSWDTTITPIKDGNHPFQMHLGTTMLLPQNRRSPLSGEDLLRNDFFDSFFNRVEKRQVDLQSKRKPLTVLPLPEQGRPADFDGAIGRFDFRLKASPTKVRVGDPITLTMTISGQGNFDRVTAPEFPVSTDWKAYTPTSRFQQGKEPGEGRKIFEQAVVARTSAPKALPELSFSYFDPDKEVYITETSPALPLVIKPTSGESDNRTPMAESTKNQSFQAPNPSLETAETKPSAAARHLTPGEFHEAITPLYSQRWYLILTLFCTLVLTGAIALYLKRYLLPESHRAKQQKQLRRTIAANIQTLEDSIQNDGGNDTFLDLCRETLRLQSLLSGTTAPEGATLADILADIHKNAEADPHLAKLFQLIERYTYGGGHLTEEERKTMLGILKTVTEERK